MSVEAQAQAAERYLNFNKDGGGGGVCPVQDCKKFTVRLCLGGWSIAASARHHFNRSHAGKLHAGRATLPRASKEQRRQQVRRASQAYRDREYTSKRPM